MNRVRQWKKVSGFVVGRSHLKTDTPCQDRTFTYQANDVHVIVLADGAGSCALSDVGATIVTEHTAKLLTRSFSSLYEDTTDEEVAQFLLAEALGAIQQAEEFEPPLKQYSSTLLFVAVCGDCWLAGHLGDGVIGYTEDGQSFVLSEPDNGEYINSTFFTTAERADQHFRILRGRLEGKSGFVLMSDGAAESLYQRKSKALAPAVQRFWSWLSENPAAPVEEALYKNLESVIRDKTTDDCSVALLSLAELTVEEWLEKSPEFQADFIGVSSPLTERRGEESDESKE